MNIKRILPMEANLFVRNVEDFIFQKEYKLPVEPDGIRCFYLDAASYNNLGDQAIALAMGTFLNDLFGKEKVFTVNETDIIKFLKSLKRQIRPKDVIVLSGGGNMGDLYPRYEAIRRNIIRTFPNNKIVVFPQTIDYSDDNYGRKEINRSRKVYNRHPDLVVCAREEKSYGIMRQIYNNVILVPDIVFYLLTGFNFEKRKKQFDYGICLRDDKESMLSVQVKSKIFCFCTENKKKDKILTTMSNETYARIGYVERYCEIQQKLEEFSECECIITDRLHGMIFSIIAGVPCIAIDNSNHKVTGVYSASEVVCGNTTVISKDNIVKIHDLAEAITNKKLRDIPSTNITGLYKKLSDLVAIGIKEKE